MSQFVVFISNIDNLIIAAPNKCQNTQAVGRSMIVKHLFILSYAYCRLQDGGSYFMISAIDNLFFRSFLYSIVL